MYDPIRGYPRVVPYVLYRDPAAAARWITEVLGFCEAIRFTVPDGGPVAHIELERHGAVLMLGLAGSRLGETASITLVFVDDVDAACARIPVAGGPFAKVPPTKPGDCAKPSSPIPRASAGNSPSTSAMSHPPTEARSRSRRYRANQTRHARQIPRNHPTRRIGPPRPLHPHELHEALGRTTTIPLRTN